MSADAIPFHTGARSEQAAAIPAIDGFAIRDGSK